jgi:hypothetical protein
MAQGDAAAGLDEVGKHVGGQDEVERLVSESGEVTTRGQPQRDVAQVGAAASGDGDHLGRDVEAGHVPDAGRERRDEAADPAADL